MCKDVGLEPLGAIIDRLMEGLAGEAPLGGEQLPPAMRSTRPPHLQLVKSGAFAPRRWEIQQDKERARMTATSGRAPATPAGHVAAADVQGPRVHGSSPKLLLVQANSP